ncbi:MAG: transglutaminase family protein [Planctomycetes bacterium]|nr:transglutaminase family protein [Planctomycetota bacterium]
MSSSQPSSDAQVRALISLLDDRSADVVARCRDRLMELGDAAVPMLREAAEGGGSLRTVLLQVLRQIEAKPAETELCALCADKSAEIDLEVGAILLARCHDPRADVASIRSGLDALAERLRPRVPEATTPGALAALLCAFFAEEEGFRGNDEDYYDPDNSFLHRVLARRTGIPISLSAVYLLVGRRLGLSLFPIAMPSHFLLQCGPEGQLFVDAFGHGRTLTRSDCVRFLVQLGVGADMNFLAPVGDRVMLTRMAANLVTISARREDPFESARWRRLFEALRGI